MNDIEEQIVLAGEVGLMASLGPDGGWVQYCDNAPGDPEDWKGDPVPVGMCASRPMRVVVFGSVHSVQGRTPTPRRRPLSG